MEQSGTLIALESEELEAENNLDISDETRNKSFVCLHLQPFHCQNKKKFRVIQSHCLQSSNVKK